MAADIGEIVIDELDNIDSIEKAKKWLEFRKTTSTALRSSLAFHREQRTIAEKSQNQSDYRDHNIQVQSLKQQIRDLQERTKKVLLPSLDKLEAREEQILASLPPENENPIEENEENLVPNNPRCMRT